jgi:PBP1b-binding outer membrane lipoprotein LpoB
VNKFIKGAVVLTAAFLLSGCSILYPNWGTTQKPSDPQTSEPVVTPTETETEAPVETPSPTPTQTKPAAPATINVMQVGVDTTSGEVYAVAEITNAAENGGSCTLTFVSGSTTKTLVVKAEANVTTTQCFPMNLPIKGLPKGAATVTVSYKSPAFVGTSTAFPISIP